MSTKRDLFIKAVISFKRLKTSSIHFISELMAERQIIDSFQVGKGRTVFLCFFFQVYYVL